MLRLMPADVRGTAKRHRQLFDVGLHGPDPLFFYRSVFPGKVRRLGRKFHMQTGGEFFSRVCRNLRLEPSEGGQAYLYGVLCHYALDAQCHPLVTQTNGEDPLGHLQMELEFDRFLMDLDGTCPPGEIHLAEHMTLTDQECGIVSRFYPGTDKYIFRMSVKRMARVQKITQAPNPEWIHWNQPLLERYRQAAEEFPDMLLKLIAHLLYNAPLGEEFHPVFG